MYGNPPGESHGKAREAYGRHTGESIGSYGSAIRKVRGTYGEHTGEQLGKYGKDVPPVTPHDPALHATPRSHIPHFPPPRPTWGHPNGPPPPLPPPTPDAARGRPGRVRDIRGKEPGQTRVQREEKWRFQKNFPYFPSPLPYLPVFYNFCKGTPRSETMPSSPSRIAPVSSRIILESYWESTG